MSSMSNNNYNNSDRKSSSSSSKDKDDEFLSNFSIELIHRVLLTEKENFMDLTISGMPREDAPSFEEFVDRFQFRTSSSLSEETRNVADVIAITMKKAFHDMVMEAIIHQNNYEPLNQMILELHKSIRSLIPNRTDLHIHPADFISNNNNNNGTIQCIIESYLQHLLKIGTVLTQLESPDRLQSTQNWIQLLSQEEVASTTKIQSKSTVMPGMTYATLLVGSTAYLHTKTQLCQSDILNFKLGHFYAPRIQTLGIPHERHLFEKKFGSLQTTTTTQNEIIPHTRKWIHRILQNHHPISLPSLRTDRNSRINLVQTYGWIDEILFSSNQYVLPELFYLDGKAIHRIREVTRESVVGSALALHAASFRTNTQQILQQETLPPELEKCQKRLVHAMKNNKFADYDDTRARETFQNGISTVVLDLAKLLNPSATAQEIDSLKSRITSVLEGNDPVLKLLDTRMRTVFRTIMMLENKKNTQTTIPDKMKSGRISSTTKEGTSKSPHVPFIAAARSEFVKAGFAFYATELASVSFQASKVIHLILQVHGSSLIEKLLLDECDLVHST